MTCSPIPASSEPGLGAASEGGDVRVVVHPHALTRFGSDGHGEQHLPLQLPPLLSRLSLHNTQAWSW